MTAGVANANVRAMPAVAKKIMDVDEFLDFAEAREERWELEDGVAYAMAPEQLWHAEAKLAAVLALRAAIARAKLPCRAVIDGPAIRISSRTAYQPDGLVYCGPRLPGTLREVPAPVIVVEVLSPSTRRRDESKKLAAYFSLASVQHYLIVDPEQRSVAHHRRGGEKPFVLHEGPIRLDPPGLDVQAEEFFADV